MLGFACVRSRNNLFTSHLVGCTSCGGQKQGVSLSDSQEDTRLSDHQGESGVVWVLESDEYGLVV